MQKLVLKLDLHDDKQKQKAMMAVSSLSGVNSISMDMKKRKLTVIGDMDPVTVVIKLRKNWPSKNIVSVGRAKESEKKKEDGKKDDGKKDDGKKKDHNEQYLEFRKTSGSRAKKSEKKKEDGKKDDGKKDDGKKKDHNEQYHEFMKTYGPRAPMPCYAPSVEENPNTCVIS